MTVNSVGSPFSTQCFLRSAAATTTSEWFRGPSVSGCLSVPTGIVGSSSDNRPHRLRNSIQSSERNREKASNSPAALPICTRNTSCGTKCSPSNAIFLKICTWGCYYQVTGCLTRGMSVIHRLRLGENFGIYVEHHSASCRKP